MEGLLPPPVGTSDWARFSRDSHCVDKTLILKFGMAFYKKNLGWSNAQVLMCFVLLQVAVMPILLLILFKVR